MYFFQFFSLVEIFGIKEMGDNIMDNEKDIQ